jgi:phospholipase/carboxylesterase
MILDGPRLAPATAGRPTSLVVLLHGYGADGNDLIDLGRHWAPVLPRAAFVAPHAPEGMGYGRQWFPLTMRDPSEFRRGVVAARPALDRFLDAELARHGLDEGRLALVGFSQGTMMALHVGLRRARPPAAVLGYSGLLAGPEHLDEATARPRLMLVHGEADDVVPAGALAAAVAALGAAGFAVEWHLIPALAHGIEPKGLALGGAFLAGALGA